MKHIIAAIALLAATLPALAQAPLDRTQEYRMWSAEQMINRMVDKYGKSIATHPAMASIRTSAASGDDVIWAFTVDQVHKFESDMVALERK